ncbi:MAG: hypothetical protein QM840_06570, partial [Verrucomicrobiota bacterium]|nr:hypothetical protein [Verrucomicrobiota bacterium]
ATVFTFFSTFRVMVLCLSFLGSLFTPVAYHDPLLFAELLGHYLQISRRLPSASTRCYFCERLIQVEEVALGLI